MKKIFGKTVLHTGKIICCFYVLLVFVQPVSAQQDTSKSSLLWEISGNGLSAPSYLYGTIHLIGKEDFFVRHEVDSVFDLCKQVAFEIKLDDMSALLGMKKKLKLPEGQTISGMMDPVDYQRLKTFLMDSFDVDIADYDDQKPLALQQVLITSLIDGETESYEVYFLMKSMKGLKKIEGLESVDDQIGVLDKIPYTEQLQWMVDGIDDTTDMQAQWDAIIRAYKAEDLEAISDLMLESDEGMMQYADLLLTDRNKKWIPVIESIIRKGPAFIAVGAAHLPFDTGVIQLLIDKGYSLKPL